MAKPLPQKQAVLVAEYAHYIAEQASLEQAIMAASLRRDMATVVDLIETAKASASFAITAARCLGLSPEFIPSIIKERAN
jgi:plasmid maintenance system antidote protein VapI